MTATVRCPDCGDEIELWQAPELSDDETLTIEAVPHGCVA